MGGIPFLQTGKITRCQVAGQSFLLLANLKLKLCEFWSGVPQFLLRVMGVNLALPIANICFYIWFTMIGLLTTVILLNLHKL